MTWNDADHQLVERDRPLPIYRLRAQDCRGREFDAGFYTTMRSLMRAIQSHREDCGLRALVRLEGEFGERQVWPVAA